MGIIETQSDLQLGIVCGTALRLPQAVLWASFEHACLIANSLGSREAESSLAGYWSLADRVRQWQRIVDTIGIEQVRRSFCVEVGSGMGLFALTGTALGFRVVGVESSSDRYAASINIARALFFEHDLHPPIVQAYSEVLPLPDASVDLVTSFQTLEHVGDLWQTLREIRRILKPGGRFFAQAPNYTSFYEVHYGVLAPLALGKAPVRQILRLHSRPTAFLEHLQWLSPAALREMLREVGFSSATVGPIGAAPIGSAPLPAAVAQLPFRARRGTLAGRIANRLSGAYHALGISADRYTQLEIWATA
jgi:ubiquinone/menaquinone biosynthesis C-methylase UbiE